MLSCINNYSESISIVNFIIYILKLRRRVHILIVINIPSRLELGSNKPENKLDQAQSKYKSWEELEVRLRKKIKIQSAMMEMLVERTEEFSSELQTKLDKVELKLSDMKSLIVNLTAQNAALQSYVLSHVINDPGRLERFWKGR